jgi:hypothetical protein
MNVVKVFYSVISTDEDPRWYVIHPLRMNRCLTRMEEQRRFHIRRTPTARTTQLPPGRHRTPRLSLTC